jgi:hypothetical protein
MYRIIISKDNFLYYLSNHPRCDKLVLYPFPQQAVCVYNKKHARMMIEKYKNDNLLQENVKFKLENIGVQYNAMVGEKWIRIIHQQGQDIGLLVDRKDLSTYFKSLSSAQSRCEEMFNNVMYYKQE